MEGTPVLALSRETLADIFRGKISKWDDDRIANDNPNVREFLNRLLTYEGYSPKRNNFGSHKK